MQSMADALVLERAEELRNILAKRNQDLRELFLLVKHKKSLDNYLVGAEEGAEMLQFLARFELDSEKDPEKGSISQLEDEAFACRFTPSPSPQLPPGPVPHALTSPVRPLSPSETRNENSVESADVTMDVDPTSPRERPDITSSASAHEPLPALDTAKPSAQSIEPNKSAFVTPKSPAKPDRPGEPVAGPSRVIPSSPARLQAAQRSAPDVHMPDVSPAPSPSRTVFTAITSLPPSALILPSTVPVTVPTPLTPTSSHPHFDFSQLADSSADAKGPPARQTHVPEFVLARTYTLPPLKTLPLEHQRRSKLIKAAKKRERAGASAPSIGPEGRREDWVPLGMNRWSAALRANPLWTRVARAQKTLSTRDWGVAFTELRLVRTFERIDALKLEGKWSFRQPKKQRGIGGLGKTHWDYLLDEMMWMRTDFREERRWKIAIAFDLSTAVLEWHKAGTRPRRLEEGIIVDWSKPQPIVDEHAPARDGDVEMSDAIEPVPAPLHVQAPKEDGPSRPLLVDADYASDESDEEQENDRQEVVDALAPAQQLDDAYAATREADSADQSELAPMQLKVEDIESALSFADIQTSMAVDASQPSTSGQPSRIDTPAQNVDSGLKSSSQDPNLASGVWEAGSQTKGSKGKGSQYSALRNEVTYSDQLVFNLDDLIDALPDFKDAQLSPPTDIADIFPDAQVYDFDITPVAAAVPEGKKKGDRRDKDDPTKRQDPTTLSRLAPVSLFQQQRPTLLGPLRPSTHWVDGEWIGLDDGPVFVDFDSPARPVDSTLVGLFDGTRPQLEDDSILPTAPRDPARRQIDANWTPADDELLRSLEEKYPRNWALIADAFNTARAAIAAERRADWECKERFKLKFRNRPEDTAMEEPPTPVSATRPQVTTRKRLASQTTRDQPTAAGVLESHKRKRHNYVGDAIRKATKRRDSAQKQAASSRRNGPAHESHNELKKAPKLTPADHSRIKHDKDARAHHEQELLRRRQQAGQQQQQQQQAILAGRLPVPQMQMPAQSGVNTPPGVASAVTQRVPQAQVPQMRAQQPQVNISQAQRVPSGSNMTPQQQQQYLQQMQQAQAQAQAQAAHAQRGALVASASASMPNTLPPSGHLSPPFSAASTRQASPNGMIIGQQSPPRPAGTPNPPGRPSSAAMLQGSPPMQHAMARQGNTPGYMQLQSNVMQHFTAEQMARAQQMMAQQQQQQPQHPGGASGTSGSGTF
ncbi:hypothetical protein PENSPDRAFT_735350 [Peniophora sp. CONT]|nr:hypothetical protein PENSPDRAFT_735350 [Peniophora sp. CONT]